MIGKVIDQDENNEKMEIDETDETDRASSTPKVGAVFSVEESPVKCNQSLNSVIRPIQLTVKSAVQQKWMAPMPL